MTKQDDRCGHPNGCAHRETVLQPKRGGIPAYCSKCKHGKGAHAFVRREGMQS